MGSSHLFDAVCVGAHPDDVELGMGATVAKMAAQGLKVAIVDLTNGEPTPHGTVELRAAEAADAARILGVSERRTLSQPNRRLFDTVGAREELAEVFRELRPRLVFGPYPTDAHPDHIAAAQIVLAARFYSKFTKTEMRGEPFYPPRVFQYMAVHMRIVADPAFIVDVSDHLGVKLDAIRAYRSQFAANAANSGIVSAMEHTAQTWGALGGVAAGEPFFSAEPLVVDSPDVVG